MIISSLVYCLADKLSLRYEIITNYYAPTGLADIETEIKPIGLTKFLKRKIPQKITPIINQEIINQSWKIFSLEDEGKLPCGLRGFRKEIGKK